MGHYYNGCGCGFSHSYIWGAMLPPKDMRPLVSVLLSSTLIWIFYSDLKQIQIQLKTGSTNVEKVIFSNPVDNSIMSSSCFFC